MSNTELRESILRRREHRATRLVNVPEVGKVLVLELSARQRASFDGAMAKDRDSSRAWLVMMTATDPETRAQLFSEDDLPALEELGATVIDPLFEAAWDISGLGREGVERERGN